VCAGAGAGAIGAAWLWPTYFRLVPGRLELLWYSPFRKRPIERTVVDLRTARVLVDLRQFVVATEAANKPLELSIALMPRRKRFAYMLFLAALSTHEPGPLPEDELVG
jgi:hypothetical protein